MWYRLINVSTFESGKNGHISLSLWNYILWLQHWATRTSLPIIREHFKFFTQICSAALRHWSWLIGSEQNRPHNLISNYARLVFDNANNWNLDTRIHFPQKRIDRGYSHFWNICVYLLKKYSPKMFQGHNISTICIHIWNLCFLKTIHNIENISINFMWI